MVFLVVLALTMPIFALAMNINLPLMVNNPNPEERLHLREEPNSNSHSLGRYYNGTKVYPIREVDHEWLEVEVGISSGEGGIGYLKGYMMKAFLAEGYQGTNNFLPMVQVRDGNRLHLRSEPSTQSLSLGLYEPGTVVLVMGFTQNWYHVQVNGDENQTGFMMAEYLTPQLEDHLSPVPTSFEAPREEHYGYVKNPNPADRLHLRTSPTGKAQSLGKYYNGVKVTVIENRDDGWSKVRIGTLDGYMESAYLAFNVPMGSVPSAMPIVLVESESGKSLNLRAGQSQKTASIGQYTNGSQVTVLGITPTWYHVQVGEQIGFMMAEYLTPQLPYHLEE